MTSCTYGFCKNSFLKVTYNHMDSYPSGFGRKFVSFIRENTLEELNEIFNKIYLVNPSEIPSENKQKELKANGLYIDKNHNTWDAIAVTNSGFLEYYLNNNYFMCDYANYNGHKNYSYLIDIEKEIFVVSKWEEKIYEYPLTSIPRDWFLKEFMI